jgi:hypothetical protein
MISNKPKTLLWCFGLLFFSVLIWHGGEFFFFFFYNLNSVLHFELFINVLLENKRQIKNTNVGEKISLRCFTPIYNMPSSTHYLIHVHTIFCTRKSDLL